MEKRLEATALGLGLFRASGLKSTGKIEGNESEDSSATQRYTKHSEMYLVVYMFPSLIPTL